ncbi:unnamed protein product [Spirodela intermedia]|uniref:Uncharacterized protein n=1 Tax=Spirodela intermedia TaxID=51605 RepID=A0A7I8JTF3_SPIIN|nr:unnamed protein product [Spirodela intermedia]CAA6673448.1 unnamed protein product [Spirodela intermedia]
MSKTKQVYEIDLNSKRSSLMVKDSLCACVHHSPTMPWWPTSRGARSIVHTCACEGKPPFTFSQDGLGHYFF